MTKITKTALIIGGVIVTIFMTLSAAFGPIWGWQGAGQGILMMGGFSWLWFSIFMTLFCGLIIWSVVAQVVEPKRVKKVCHVPTKDTTS